MPRYLFSLLLVIAVMLFGVIPHAGMAGESRSTSVPCHDAQAANDGQPSATLHCGTADHSTPGACAIACLGSIAATWFPTPSGMPAALGLIVHRAEVSLVLNGRTGETADRPPKIHLNG